MEYCSGTELVCPEQIHTDVLLPPEANTQMNIVSLWVLFLLNQYNIKHQQRTPTGTLKHGYTSIKHGKASKQQYTHEAWLVNGWSSTGKMSVVSGYGHTSLL